MTLGAGALLLSLVTAAGASRATPTGAFTMVRSLCSDEAARAASGASEASPPQPPADDASARARASPLSNFIERATIGNTTAPPRTRRRSTYPARTTLAMQVDLWQGLSSIHRPDRPALYSPAYIIFCPRYQPVHPHFHMVAAETFVNELDAKNQPSIQRVIAALNE